MFQNLTWPLWVLSLWGKRKLILAGVSLVALLVAGLWIYNAGKNTDAVSTYSKAVKLKERQDEIRNHRPDTEQLIDRLLRGTF